MARQIIESSSVPPLWCQDLGVPAAQRLLAWAQAQADECLADVFGYHAVQAGWPGYDTLRQNRMPHRWLAGQEFDGGCDGVHLESSAAPHLWFDSRAWPWTAESLDLVVLPHTLERSADPHACLREVERVLIPEGQVFITGINPWSWWGWRLWRGRRRGEQDPSALWPVQPIAPHRLRDWLHLLGFEIQLQRFTGWTPPWRIERRMQRWSWLEALWQRWFPVLGGAYLIVAVKRVPGGRLLEGRRWRKLPSPSAITAPVTSLEGHHRSRPESESLP